MRITLEHLAGVRGFSPRPGFCRSGARRWAAQHALDWDAFRRDGIDADALLATGDPLAIALVQHAQALEANRGR